MKKPKVADRTSDEHLFGCTVDLAPDEEPDGCVLDYGAPVDCIYAVRRRTKWTCPFWVRKPARLATLNPSKDPPNA